ncbi:MULTISPECIES: carbohydrate ABC transporter permease [Mycolicibacterium]|jgi:ABC-type glycerol-3-phosphate transport system permease component|uniref:Carbohydrate ABC transporter permease n=2 Tax=Actinomycetes TaxID=1760 RepID=A0ABW9L269_9MYCO|nr:MULTISPECIES: carbohydrate ABC transporter permease [Mycolicibacterium]MBN3507439.1 carbohydrate ABC transporter permease [Mycolicibacterium septicum]QRY49145.1 carbohydrate ABC transporter permease [Mycolicibacterium septicum]SEQ15322.1 ABC-type glycerol-3-phosphate transport system, permease component [Mycobacterium sp. 88mf]SFF37396.1 ABC-type glycerol-3-phosphate transport system, permease component [Mycobacterium sp. 455mf]
MSDLRRKSFSALRIGFLLAGVAIVVLPLAWIALASFKTPGQLNDPWLIAFSPSMDNWKHVLDSTIVSAVVRSAIVAFVTVGISITVGSMAAYSISRYKTGGSATRFGMLAAQVLPPAVLVFPFLTAGYAMNLSGTLIPVIFAHISFVLPFVTWFLIGLWEAVPRSLEEQALVDGLTRFAAFRKVMIPQVYPGIGASAIFGFILSWNDMFYGLILAPNNNQLLPVAISSFNTFRGVDLGSMSAAIIISIVPVIIAAFFVQRRLIQGMGGGAVKF